MNVTYVPVSLGIKGWSILLVDMFQIPKQLFSHKLSSSSSSSQFDHLQPWSYRPSCVWFIHDCSIWKDIKSANIRPGWSTWRRWHTVMEEPLNTTGLLLKALTWPGWTICLSQESNPACRKPPYCTHSTQCDNVIKCTNRRLTRVKTHSSPLRWKPSYSWNE